MIKTSSRITTKLELEQSNAPSCNFNQSPHLNLSFYIFKDVTKVTFFIQVFLPDPYYTTTVQDDQELMTDCMNASVLCGRTPFQHILRGTKRYESSQLSHTVLYKKYEGSQINSPKVSRFLICQALMEQHNKACLHINS